MKVSRRAVLFGGAGVLGLAGAGVLTDVLPGGQRVRRLLGMTGPVGKVPDVPAGPVVTTRSASKARNMPVTVITMAPDGFTAENLPKCVALHGYGGNASWMVDLGMPKFLTAAVRVGVKPFAVVSVDGGQDSYWVEKNGDDPQLSSWDDTIRRGNRFSSEQFWEDNEPLRHPDSITGSSLGGCGAAPRIPLSKPPAP